MSIDSVVQAEPSRAKSVGPGVWKYSHELESDRNAVGVASHAVDAIVLAVQFATGGLAERHRAWSGLGSKWT